MKQSEIKQRIAEIEDRIIPLAIVLSELLEAKLKVQAQCNHPKSQTKLEYHNTWDGVSTYKCKRCGKGWDK